MTYEIRFIVKYDCPFLYSQNLSSTEVFLDTAVESLMAPAELKAVNKRLGKKFKNFDKWKIITTETESKTSYTILECEIDRVR